MCSTCDRSISDLSVLQYHSCVKCLQINCLGKCAKKSKMASFYAITFKDFAIDSDLKNIKMPMPHWGVYIWKRCLQAPFNSLSIIFYFLVLEMRSLC